MHEITVVNPGRKATKKKGKKVAGKKRKRKSNPKKSKPRKRRSNPRKKTRKRRRSNPSMGSLGLVPNMKRAVYMLFGMAFAAHGVMRWGSTQGGAQFSQTAGTQWGAQNAIVAILSGWFGSKIVKRFFNQEAAGAFYMGAFVLVAMKLFWFHVLRAIPGGAAYFGAVPGGTVRYDDNGNVLMAQNGQWVTMQGYDGLAEATPLGGELAPATPLGGQLAPATPLGQGVDADPWLNGDPWMNGYGHIMSSNSAGSPADDWGGRTWRGSADPYLAAYS